MAERIKTGGRQKGTPNKASARAGAAGAPDSPDFCPPIKRAREPAASVTLTDDGETVRAWDFAGAAPTPARKAAAPAFPPYRLEQTARLVAYDRNPRTHSPAQIDLLAKLITEYGWTNPILVDGKRGVIAGHGRLRAALKLGMATVPVIELSHLTAAQKRAYVMADNASAEKAGWDDELRALELGELGDLGFDLSLTGFGARELGALLGTGGEGLEPPAETHAETCPQCGQTIAP